MTFAEKLVFLMNLTSTSSKQLADALTVDPSLISLLRTGKRTPPKNHSLVAAAAAYFGKKSGSNYQRVALSEAMGRRHLQLQIDTGQLSDAIFDWLTDNDDQAGQFLNTFDRFSVKTPQAGDVADAGAPDTHAPTVSVYYGNDGKRGAIDALLDHLLSLNHVRSLMLSTDENCEWLFEDPAFHRRFQDKLMRLLNSGCRLIRLAGPISNVDEAFDSLNRWVPMYMTGNVESWYYPRFRDGLYKRTFFAAPDIGAVISSSTSDQRVSRMVILALDGRIANALAGDFNDILRKCRPLMTTYSTAAGAGGLLRCISRFETDRGDRIQQSLTLSSITSPPELLDLVTRCAPPGEAETIADSLAESQRIFRKSLSEYTVIDIHRIASAQEVCAGNVPVAASYLCPRDSICYTPETYILHLEAILDLMERNDNYIPVMLPRRQGMHSLMVKEGRQVLLIRPGFPLLVFEISQPYVAEACREYLLQFTDTSLSRAAQKRLTANEIEKLISQLQHDV